MTAADLVEHLANHRMLSAAPREELAWLAAHGTLRRFAPGELLSVKGAPVTALYVMLSGRFTLSVDRGAGPQRIMQWQGGEVGGLLPFSRLVNAPGNSIAEELSETFEVSGDTFPS